jgi:hypothetical protein
MRVNEKSLGLNILTFEQFDVTKTTRPSGTSTPPEYAFELDDPDTIFA